MKVCFHIKDSMGVHLFSTSVDLIFSKLADASHILKYSNYVLRYRGLKIENSIGC